MPSPTVARDGDAGAGIRKRLSKARNSFNILGKVWKSESYNVLPALVYGAEMWRMTVTDELRLDRFVRVCLKKIVKIR